MKNITLSEFIENSPTPFHNVEFCRNILTSNGYIELFESNDWDIKKGNKYFVTRNNSSIIAFITPFNSCDSFMLTASHSDSPSFKLKENFALPDKNYICISTEKYGGMISSTWLDKPLGIAGRVILDNDGDITSKLVNFENIALIPNLAIHLTRNTNESTQYNPAIDMLPILSEDLNDKIITALSTSRDKILSKDLFLYNQQKPVVWGDYISAPRLDDLQCAYSSIISLIESDATDNSLPVCCIFDNEEVGSATKQGAASTFLEDTLERISHFYMNSYSDYKKALANSFMLSCDNAHAQHPNHPECTDNNNSVFINKGIVIKYNANQKYTTDSISAALFKTICKMADVPYQVYANRSDIAGGSTLGNISNTKVSINTVDIGLAQLAMHSSFETAGITDIEYLIKALKIFYKKRILLKNNTYRIVDCDYE